MKFYTEETQKAEAIARMELLGMSKMIIDDFKKTNIPQIYEPPYGSSYYPDEEDDSALLKEIGRLNGRGMLVWGVIRCTMSYNRQPVTIDCILFVSKGKRNMAAERKDLLIGYPFVYTICKEYPSLHDHGSIAIYMSPGGTPLRAMQ